MASKTKIHRVEETAAQAAPPTPEPTPAAEAAGAARTARPAEASPHRASPSTPPTFPKEFTTMKEQMDKMMKATEELVSFSQGNLEALIKSNQILVQGLQDLSRQTLAAAQAQFEEAVAVFKALPGVKSVKEALDLQTSLTRSAFEKSVAETSRLTDASFKLAEQVTAPLVARLTAAVDKFGKFTA